LAAGIYAEFDAALLLLEQQPQKTVFNFLTPEQVQANPSLQDPFLGQRMLPPAEPIKDPATKLSRYLEVYIAHLEANVIGDMRERRTRRKRCEEFILLIGDIHLSDVRKVHAYQYADWMVAKGLANKTIKSNISRISGMLTKAEQRGLIDPNPFTNLKLADYGRASIPWSPFEPDEMTKIFAQDMREQERLILTILATTGARLDEIALLEWSQVKVDFGITFLDLRDSKRAKNIQSRRIIPIHSKVAPLLAARGEGRVFDYPLDENGKAQNAAGKRLAPLIDNVTEDPLKVIHSLRGTFKDMLKNAGVTAEMTDQLESGDLGLSDIADQINGNQVSKELNDRITGHAQPDTAGRYGVGHALIPRAAAVEKLAVEFLPAEIV
jgi:integrase